ncbi:MAG: hypothetical protein ACE5JP_04855 [Candidatus Bipolaricaulia bacterium]
MERCKRFGLLGIVIAIAMMAVGPLPAVAQEEPEVPPTPSVVNLQETVNDLTEQVEALQQTVDRLNEQLSNVFQTVVGRTDKIDELDDTTSTNYTIALVAVILGGVSLLGVVFALVRRR